MLYTGCILREVEFKSLEYLVISVMSRHTENDGIAPRSDLNLFCDEHWPDLGPSSSFIGDYYKRGLLWVKFEERYRRELGQKIARVMTLVFRARVQNICIVCIEETAEKCHRRILAEECGRFDQTLQITHL